AVHMSGSALVGQPSAKKNDGGNRFPLADLLNSICRLDPQRRGVPIPAPTPSRPAALLFAALVVCSLTFTYSVGHLTGHSPAPRLTCDPPRTDKEDEYVELRKAVERHRSKVSAEHQAVIDECLLVMRQCREDRAKQNF